MKVLRNDSNIASTRQLQHDHLSTHQRLIDSPERLTSLQHWVLCVQTIIKQWEYVRTCKKGMKWASAQQEHSRQYIHSTTPEGQDSLDWQSRKTWQEADPGPGSACWHAIPASRYGWFSCNHWPWAAKVQHSTQDTSIQFSVHMTWKKAIRNITLYHHASPLKRTNHILVLQNFGVVIKLYWHFDGSDMQAWKNTLDINTTITKITSSEEWIGA